MHLKETAGATASPAPRPRYRADRPHAVKTLSDKTCPLDGAAKRPRGTTAPRGRIGSLKPMAPRLAGARDGLHRRLRRARCDAGRRGRRRRDRAAGRRQNHRLPHHGVAACRPAAARRGTGRLTHRRTPGRLAADRRRIARVAADRGATGPPMMPMATRLGVPRNRHHSHAGERSNQPQKDLASHGRNPSRGPRDDRRCPDTGQPVPRARNDRRRGRSAAISR